MRDGWVETSLGDIFESCKNGKNYKEDENHGGLPITRIQTIADGKIDLQKVGFGNLTEVNSFDFLLCEGDILFSHINSLPHVGKVAFVTKKHLPLIHGMNLLRMRFKPLCDSQFMFYLMQHIEMREKVRSIAQIAVNQVSVNIANLKSLAILLPKLSEQKRIVDLISSVDSYIEALQQHLESAKRSRNAVLHEFMNGEGTAFEQTQLGQIAKFLNGKAYSKEELLTVGKYRVLRVGNFFSNNNWYWSDLELEPNKYCENGDLLYAWSASFGPRLWNEEKVIYHYHIWKVNPDESQVDKKWLFYWLEDDVERIKSASGSGSIMMHVTKSEIEKRAIRLPPLSEQKRQLVILESFDQNIHTLESLIVSTNQLRSSVLSDLISGDYEIPASYDKVMGSA